MKISKRGFINTRNPDNRMSFPHVFSGNLGQDLYSGSPIKTFGDDNSKNRANKTFGKACEAVASSLKNERGSFLALAIILVVLLTFSGLAFLHADFLEKRMSMEERWNQKAFYLAQAGIERARESFKIDTAGASPSWTPILDPADAAYTGEYPQDTNPDPLLCPDVTRGCVIPSFQTATFQAAAGNADYVTGQPITAPDMPFASAGDVGSYSVRAFNNGGTGDAGMTDGDNKITIRALGSVNGRTKVVEATVLATSGMKLINCLGAEGSACPERAIGGSLELEPVMEGHEPAASPDLPSMTPALSSDQNYYRKPSNFGFAGVHIIPITGTTLPNPVGGNYYSKTNGSGNLTISGSSTGTGTIVIFATGRVTVDNKVELNNTIVVGENAVDLNPNSIVRAPLPYPAIIAGNGGVTGNGDQTTVYGNIFTTGTIHVNPLQVHGSITASEVSIQGNTQVTDDLNPAYYAFMPGFDYPDDQKGTSVQLGSWKEVQ